VKRPNYKGVSAFSSGFKGKEGWTLIATIGGATASRHSLYLKYP
jgi:hypothetical protein